MERRPSPERLHQSQGDNSQEREGASDQKGKSISNILKLTKDATVGTTLETVAGMVGSAGGAERTANTLRELMAKRRGAVPESGKTSAAPEARIAGPSDQGSEARDIAGEGWDNNLDKKFKNATALYTHTRIIMQENLERRLLENPNPTNAEWDRGIFNEELYPQFIDAIPVMWSKGYETWSSESRRLTDSFKSPLADDAETHRLESFAAGEPQAVPEGMLIEVLKDFPNITLEGEGKDDFRTHQIDGSFVLDQTTIEGLELIGVKVEIMGVGDKGYSRIFFEADEETTLRAVKETCDQIAAILPDRGQPAPPRMTEGAIAFRAKYSRDTPVASLTAPGAVNIPGRSARETATRETSSPESSSSSSSSLDMEM
ncbi:hypothetical protein KSF_080480 [Reticulibacter mediterranei]|uniref:Uncharacterized protein n=1 Tax=Reticulibacter mediterranei TaxID=2778369 RepID=A0A8J3IT07_9CHLR|nr:hypothetical protein [Reticulibacter mediterranei]GHO98000.1 hypothetical protein KSF_080480 [Reticulibacter mediterranei]